MKTLIVRIVISALFLLVGNLRAEEVPQLKPIASSGMGIIVEGDTERAYKDAIAEAKEKAIQRRLGKLMSADRRMKLKKVLENQVYLNAHDFIGKTEKISRKDSKTFVKVKVRVSIQQHKLQEKLDQMARLEDAVQKQQIGFYISQAEQEAKSLPHKSGRIVPSPCESIMIEVFEKLNFLERVYSLKEDPPANLDERDTVKALGRKLDIAWLVIGSSEIRPIPEVVTGLVERLVSLHLRVYDCRTGKILIPWEGAVRGGGASVQDAEKDGCKKIVNNATTKLIQKIYEIEASNWDDN